MLKDGKLLKDKTFNVTLYTRNSMLSSTSLGYFRKFMLAYADKLKTL